MSTAETGDAVDARVRAMDAEGHVLTVRVRYFAAARAAAGVESEMVRLAPSSSAGDAVEHLRAAHPGTLSRVLDAASFLLNGVAVRDMSVPLPDGAELDVLPPFAGG